MRWMGPAILAAAFTAALAACGQKGPLYLPPPTAAPQSKPPPAGTDARRPTDRPFPDVPATNDMQ